MCSMESYDLLSVATHELKTLLHATLDTFCRHEVRHVSLIVMINDEVSSRMHDSSPSSR